MKKLILSLIFLLSAACLFATENIIYTIKYAVNITIVSSSIFHSECAPDGSCYSMVSITYIKKDSYFNPNNNITVRQMKISGYSPAQEPTILFKQDSFARIIELDPHTTVEFY